MRFSLPALVSTSLCLVYQPAHAFNLQLGGDISYEISKNDITVKVGKITNTMTTNSKPIKIRLAASKSPFDWGINYTSLYSGDINPLQTGYHYHDLVRTGKLEKLALGDYYISLIVLEGCYQAEEAGKFCGDDIYRFNKMLHVDKKNRGKLVAFESATIGAAAPVAAAPTYDYEAMLAARRRRQAEQEAEEAQEEYEAEQKRQQSQAAMSQFTNQLGAMAGTVMAGNHHHSGGYAPPPAMPFS